MKKQGVLHGELSRFIATLGHGQTLVIADYGLPVPAQVPLVDLAVSRGVPSFLDVLDAVLSELSVEKITLAKELEREHPDLFDRIQQLAAAPRELIGHDVLKERLASAAVIVRTGEWTSYANIILKSSVVF
ncbi:D-ribose pyranase [Peptococcaceae bacterium CEB3]|nr:D-ribose pyranase [Peptococcaceae bacterium CEB3]